MNIIYLTLQLIQSDNWYGVSKNMEITKGKYKLGGFKKKTKRIFYSFLKK
jgi:hypothetical protein